MASPLLPGDPVQLGTYYLDGRLGRGGQGVVYDGYDAAGTRVAVKALHGVSDGDREALRREIRAWRRVAPFCTAKLLHEDLDGPAPYVVSEYVAGSDLRRVVEGRDGDSSDPYAAEELRRLAIGVATALVAVHRAGVVHRDLKPENVLLSPDGPRVIDFGIARVVEGTSTAGLPMGTLRYMPPERYRGAHGDGKVDVWGWGAVVLFAATGRHAFDGTSAEALAYQVATHEPDTSALEEPLRSLVSAALSKEPDDRPTSEELLLSLVGRADLADVVKEVGPGDAHARGGSGERSRPEVAEEVFNGLDGAARETVSPVLLRLVAPGERAEDTLRSARRTEFADAGTADVDTEAVLRAFTEVDILVWEGDTVTLSSAALIRSWPRLRDWVEAEREGLGTHQRLSEASRAWDDHGRRNGDLLQGTALERTRNWAATGRRRLTLNRTERDFLAAGSGLARRRGRLRVLVSGVLAVLLIVATGAALVTFDQRQTIVGQRDRAASAQVAGDAQSLRRSDPELGRRLAVASARLADTPESWSALLTLRNQLEEDAFKPLDFAATEFALDSTGRTLMAAGGTRVEFWDVRARERTGTYTAPARVHRVELSEDGEVAAVLTDDGRTRLLDADSARPRGGRTYRTTKQDGHWPGIRLSPRGTYLMTGTSQSDDSDTLKSTLDVWDTRGTDRRLTTVTTREPVFLLWDSSFSPDERVLSVPGDGKGEPFTWIDTRTKEELPVQLPSAIEAKDIQGPVVFSPDGKKAALATKGEINVFERDTGLGTEFSGAEKYTDYPLRFSPDGRFVAQNGTVWDTESLERESVMRYTTTQSECHPSTALRFTADGSKLRCAGTDGVVRTLDVSTVTKSTKRSDAYYEEGVVSADQGTIALRETGGIDILSASTRTKRLTVTSRARRESELVHRVELSRDGRRLAVLSEEEIEIWDISGKKAAPLGGLPIRDVDPNKTGTTAFAFSPDNESFATLDVAPDGTNVLSYWDLGTMRRVREVRADLGAADNGSAVFFHPDGGSVYAAPNFGRVAFPSGRVLSKGAPSLEVDSVSEDGTKLYSHPRGFRSYLRTWDARTLRPEGNDVRTGAVSPPLGAQERATAVSPDGRLFATMHESGHRYQVRIWDSRTRAQLGIALAGSAEEILALTFTPDSSALTGVDRGGRFFTHPLEPERLIRDLCAESGPLTEKEWEKHIPDVPYRKTC
ncbi:WD40 repeat domain-containing serine/threonine protein kinase [Streptomyces oceani]|uniref:WD40 repeat domain-containing serine/threonine protein kinase n=1 Tax=Streptomyces oceani TaxID=1075402 RepID=UPI000872FA0F|nr:WD40 repeat domain-containing serine/threonine protein kinase [Streptomyces oceani]